MTSSTKSHRPYTREELINAMEMGAIALKTMEIGINEISSTYEANSISKASNILKQEVKVQKNWRKSDE